MFKAVVGFFLIPVMILMLFGEGRGADRRVDPNTVPPQFQQQQQQQLPQFQQQQPVRGNTTGLQDVTW